MSNSDRPLSPHISVYRWPITMTLSILHRATGVALSVGFIVLTLWLMQIAAGPEQYQYFRVSMASPFGQFLLIGWTFAFFLHFANGLRHLVWDAGHGFEIRQANISAWAVLIVAVLLTAGFWVSRLLVNGHGVSGQ